MVVLATQLHAQTHKCVISSFALPADEPRLKGKGEGGCVTRHDLRFIHRTFEREARLQAKSRFPSPPSPKPLMTSVQRAPASDVLCKMKNRTRPRPSSMYTTMVGSQGVLVVAY